jgi:peroxiredoxin
MGILRRLSLWMGKQDHMTHIVAGNIAPRFSLKSLDNKEYSLNTLMERGPVVAAFFKISCPVCQFTFPFSNASTNATAATARPFSGSPRTTPNPQTISRRNTE